MIPVFFENLFIYFTFNLTWCRDRLACFPFSTLRMISAVNIPTVPNSANPYALKLMLPMKKPPIYFYWFKVFFLFFFFMVLRFYSDITFIGYHHMFPVNLWGFISIYALYMSLVSVSLLVMKKFSHYFFMSSSSFSGSSWKPDLLL